MPDGISTVQVDPAEAVRIIEIQEGQFVDVKAKEVSGVGISKAISALANADGGDLYVGIRALPGNRETTWDGFENDEAANGLVQTLERVFPLGTDFQYEFIRCSKHPGLVLHLQIAKTAGITRASDGSAYVRRGAQNLPATSPDALRRLEYAKGVTTFEAELTNVPKDVCTDSIVLHDFVNTVVPRSTGEAWLRKQALLREEKPTVAGVLLFADEPQAHLPKRCGIKLYRYRTTEAEGSRETLDSDPITVEGCLYQQIGRAVAETKQMIEGIPRLGDNALEAISYPPEALHEIITNAVLHRDYSVADDVHIRVFDNRIEVQSPGRLPAHITVSNILSERYARNGAIVRILNKFPDPPNKDVGEGLNTAFDAMYKLGLKQPVISELENAVLVVIRHEVLASPEETIMEYLDHNPTIKNAQARAITHIRADYQMKAIFNRMVTKGLIEQVPGTRTASTAYRRTTAIGH